MLTRQNFMNFCQVNPRFCQVNPNFCQVNPVSDLTH